MASIDYWEGRGKKIYSGSKPTKTQQEYRNQTTSVTDSYSQTSQDFYTQQPVFTEAELIEYDNAKVYKSKLDRIAPSIQIIKNNIQNAQQYMSDGGLICDGYSLNPRFDSILEKFYSIERAISVSSDHFKSIIDKVEGMTY